MRFVGHQQQLGGVRLVQLEDGSERGVRALEFRTTTGLEFASIVDRAFDIGWCRFQGRSIAWHSPTGFAAPWYRESQGLGFLRTFPGGLFVTCGLDHILFPETDPHDTYNYPGRQETEYGLHGRISSTPGRIVGYGEEWGADGCTLFVEGEARQVGALAENLLLRRRIEVDLDGRTIRWRDEVVNEGHYRTPHMMLYHINLGAPLLDESSELLAPIAAVLFATPTATGGEDEHLRFAGPQAGFLEQAFSHDLVAGSGGRCTVALMNHADDAHPWGIALRFDKSRFPFFFQWRYLDEGTYVLGLEPSTNGITGRQGARGAGELLQLEPGEARVYEQEIEIIVGADERDRVKLEIQQTSAQVEA